LLTYADQNRLSRVSIRNASGDTAVMDYQYDGRGQRVSKINGGGDIHYIYGPSGELLGEYSATPDGEFKDYVYLNGQPVAIITRRKELVIPPGEELIVDNGDGGTSSTGSWRTRSSTQDYGADHLLANKAANSSYRWTATPPGSNYQVYAWWAGKKNQSANVSYTIRYGAGETDTVAKSHKTGGGQWQLLGSFHSTDGQDYVEVTSSSNKFVADAIRWVQVNEPIITLTESTNFIHFDHLGTPRRVTDDKQVEVWQWESTPFGDSAPAENPDGDAVTFTMNLRFPGQYYDAESGLHYNYFRTYEPRTGRYVESDPIGLRGGLNPYGYVLNAPVQFIDPHGLKVSGEWTKQPKFNLVDYGLTSGEFITPYLTKWGYLKVFRIHGYAAGYVNVDVRCRDTNGCGEREWEIHQRIGVSFRGHKDIGPNVAASAVSSAATPVAGMATSIVTLGGSALTALLEILGEVETRGGDKIQWLSQIGPTAICLGTQR
jgi:RHS repeat-associated protein